MTEGTTGGILGCDGGGTELLFFFLLLVVLFCSCYGGFGLDY